MWRGWLVDDRDVRAVDQRGDPLGSDDDGRAFGDECHGVSQRHSGSNDRPGNLDDGRFACDDAHPNPITAIGRPIAGHELSA